MAGRKRPEAAGGGRRFGPGGFGRLRPLTAHLLHGRPGSGVADPVEGVRSRDISILVELEGSRGALVVDVLAGRDGFPGLRPLTGADHHPRRVGDFAQRGGDEPPIRGPRLLDGEGHQERDVVAMGDEGGGRIVASRLERPCERGVRLALRRSGLRERDLAAEGVGAKLLDDRVVHHAVRPHELIEEGVLEAVAQDRDPARPVIGKDGERLCSAAGEGGELGAV